MMKSPTQCSNRFITKRDIIALAITLAFVAAFPLFVSIAVHEADAQGPRQIIDLSSEGHLLQITQDRPVQLATAHMEGW